MAEQVYKFTGTVAYVSKKGRKFKNEEAEVWTARLYPKTAADRAAIKATGVKNKVQEDDGEKSGIEGLYYTFRSTKPYEIVDADGNPLDKMVANGSEAEITLWVETFNSPSYGPQARSQLRKVRVTKFIEYVPEKTEAVAEAPAETPKADLPVG